MYMHVWVIENVYVTEHILSLVSEMSKTGRDKRDDLS